MIGTTVAASLRDEQAVSSALEQRLMDAEPTPGPVNAPLETGTILQERYRIVGVLAQEPEATLYEAEDLRMCWNCSALQADVEGQFCEACGAERVKKPMLRLRETFLIGEPEYAEGGGRFQQNERLYVVEAVFVTAATARQQGLRLVAGYQSDPGKVRDIDEDSVLVLQFAAVCEARSAPTLAFFAVADGIGGHAAGEVASRAAIRSLTEELLRRVFLPAIGGEVLLPESLASHLVEAVHVANEVVLAIRQQKQSDMGSTLTAALVYEAQAIVTSVGDSRTYLMRSGKLAQVTRDHSVVASLIAAGLAKPEEIYTHEKKSVIYRSLGDKPDLEVDTFALTLEPGDRLLLCCDGLWELVRDSIIEDVLLEQPDPQAACDKLVELANQSGGDDNISVIVINVQRLAPIQ
jgi:serine/threonine protein phosphatase PrpC